MPTLPSCSDYSTSISVKELIKAPKLSGGAPEIYKNKPIRYAGGFCIVFPYIVGNNKYAVRCWHAYLEGAKERTKKIAESLKKLHLPYFVGFEYVDNGIATSTGVQPIVIMDWVDAKPLKTYIEENLGRQDILCQLADSFLKMTKDLHDNNISHGDLQHGNIMVKSNGEIVLVDYDSMYVPELDGWTDEISGLVGYQHPARWANKFLSPKADYFSEMIIYVSIIALSQLPELWKDFKIKDSETLLFSADDIKSKGTTPIFSILDSIEACRKIVEQIKNALACNSINDIEPLDENYESMIDIISGLWGDNGYRPAPSFVKTDIVKVTSKW